MNSQSLSDKLCNGFALSLEIGYATVSQDGYYIEWRTDSRIPIEVMDMVTGWADGLVHKYIHKMMTGQCSLMDLVNFDIATAELQIDNDIATMKHWLAIVGSPRIITC